MAMLLGAKAAAAASHIACQDRSFHRRHGSTRICCSQEVAAAVVGELSDDDAILQRLEKSAKLRSMVQERLFKDLDLFDGELSSLSPSERIKQGFLKFKSEAFSKKPKLFQKLASGQHPKFMVIACSDSRVCPSTILGFEPGEAFVVRNIANMVPPYQEGGFPGTSAALEFATKHLKVENILVIGHSRCGGIKALMSQEEDASPWSDFIQSWIEIGKPARRSTLAAAADQELEHQCAYCEKEAIRLSLNNVLTFPWIKDAVESGRLALHGGYYNFVDGSFEYWPLDAQGNTGQVSKF